MQTQIRVHTHIPHKSASSACNGLMWAIHMGLYLKLTLDGDVLNNRVVCFLFIVHAPIDAHKAKNMVDWLSEAID